MADNDLRRVQDASRNRMRWQQRARLIVVIAWVSRGGYEHRREFLTKSRARSKRFSDSATIRHLAAVTAVLALTACAAL